MEFLQTILRTVIGGVLTLFADHPVAGLALISVLAGIGMLWLFGRTSNQAAIRKTKRRLQAYLLELRLFGDEPSLIWKAQAGLLAYNARYIALMLVPVVILTAPMAVVLMHLESFYGMRPLPLGEESIVTVQLKRGLDARLEAPEGVAVETPGVRVPSERQVSWRIRPLKEVSGALRVVTPEGTFEKQIAAGRGLRYVSDRRVSSAWDLLWHPAEKKLPDGAVEWIEVRYPAAQVAWLGIETHWLVWFLLFSMASALLLKGRFKVAF
jgi:hypothetical protein